MKAPGTHNKVRLRLTSPQGRWISRGAVEGQVTQSKKCFVSAPKPLPPACTGLRLYGHDRSPPPPGPCPQVDDVRLAAAHYVLRPFCLRRLKEEVEQKLPAKVRHTHPRRPPPPHVPGWTPRAADSGLLGCPRPQNAHSQSYISLVHLPPPPLQVETRIACPLSKLQTFWYRRCVRSPPPPPRPCPYPPAPGGDWPAPPHTSAAQLLTMPAGPLVPPALRPACPLLPHRCLPAAMQCCTPPPFSRQQAPSPSHVPAQAAGQGRAHPAADGGGAGTPGQQRCWDPGAWVFVGGSAAVLGPWGLGVLWGVRRVVGVIVRAAAAGAYGLW